MSYLAAEDLERPRRLAGIGRSVGIAAACGPKGARFHSKICCPLLGTTRLR